MAGHVRPGQDYGRATAGHAVGRAVAARGSSPSGPGTVQPSASAIDDIPGEFLARYIAAAQRCEGPSWTVLAAIAKLDTDHGRRAGVPGTTGSPIAFTSDRWQAVATDGDDDGRSHADSPDDVLASAAAELCPGGTTTNAAEELLGRHRVDPAYVQAAVNWSRRYATVALAYAPSDYTLPVDPREIATTDALARPHHDYPAIDLALTVGTPLRAITSGRIIAAARDGGNCGGTVVLHGDDGATYTYCHLSAITVTISDRVATGQLLGASGGQPGTPGAGRSTGPHLHLQVQAAGRLRCPQPLLLAIAAGQRTTAPTELPTSGCTF